MKIALMVVWMSLAPPPQHHRGIYGGGPGSTQKPIIVLAPGVPTLMISGTPISID